MIDNPPPRVATCYPPNDPKRSTKTENTVLLLVVWSSSDLTRFYGHIVMDVFETEKKIKLERSLKEGEASKNGETDTESRLGKLKNKKKQR